MKMLVKWCLCLVAALSLTGHGAAIYAAGLKKERLSVGYIESQIHGVNRLDAEAAFKTLARTVGVANGYDVGIEVDSFDNAGQFVATLADKIINLILLDSWSYLKIVPQGMMEPLFVTSDRGQATVRYLLLVRKNSAVKSLSDLRGRSLNLITGQSSKLGRHWLDTIVLAQEASSPEVFFSRMEYMSNPMSTVLPVFFGKRDAALVDETQFMLMAELNPQLNILHAIESSAPLLNAIICLSRKGWSSQRFKMDLVSALADLHRNPAGQQILTLFKAGRLVPFQDHYLNSVRDLHGTLPSRSVRTSGVMAKPAPPESPVVRSP